MKEVKIMMNTKESLITKIAKVNEDLVRVEDIIAEYVESYKAANAHRHAHIRGMEDQHTLWQGEDSHIVGLSALLTNTYKELKEFKVEWKALMNKLYYMECNLDTECDVEADADLSHRETLAELGWTTPAEGLSTEQVAEIRNPMRDLWDQDTDAEPEIEEEFKEISKDLGIDGIYVAYRERVKAKRGRNAGKYTWSDVRYILLKDEDELATFATGHVIEVLGITW